MRAAAADVEATAGSRGEDEEMAQLMDADTLKRRLDEGTAVVVDVREIDEFAREHIAGARNVPLGALQAGTIAPSPSADIVFVCRSGARTRAQTGRLTSLCPDRAHVLDGGIDAWKRAGHPVVRNPAAPLELQRQVQIAVGSLILLGLLLAWLVSPSFLVLPAAIGAGLVFAGISGFCGMARLLAAMPWNRPGNEGR